MAWHMTLGQVERVFKAQFQAYFLGFPFYVFLNGLLTLKLAVNVPLAKELGGGVEAGAISGVCKVGVVVVVTIGGVITRLFRPIIYAAVPIPAATATPIPMAAALLLLFPRS